MIPARPLPCPGNVTQFSGDGGTGKSTLLQQLAAAGADGAPLFGRRVAPGPVIYVNAEDDADELHRRMDRIARDMKRPPSCFRHLHLLSLYGKDAALSVAEERSNRVNPTHQWRELERRVGTVRPRAVILDPLADLFVGQRSC
jgi:RecA-family ATPase